MRKITEQLLLEISKTLNDASDAMNNLERMNKNKILYPSLKSHIQGLATKIEDQYGLREYSNINSRDDMLEQEKEDAGQ